MLYKHISKNIEKSLKDFNGFGFGCGGGFIVYISSSGIIRVFGEGQHTMGYMPDELTTEIIYTKENHVKSILIRNPILLNKILSGDIHIC